jgi:PAS domain S-box-containing protein
MNDLVKPDLKHGVPLSCIPELGHCRRMKRKLKLRPAAVCAAVIMIVTCRGLALDPGQPGSSYLRKNFTMEDGLPANEVNTILQTQNGFLWVGTEAGLARFDGERFTPIKLGSGVAQLPVLSLSTTPQGDLWVGTNAGLARIPRSALDHFDRALVTMYHAGPGQSDQILCIHRSRAGTLWVGTIGGLFRFDRDSFFSIIPHDMISRIEEDSDGHLLIITGHGFVELDGARIIPHPEIAQQLGVATNAVFHVFEDRKGVTWYCSSAGVARRVGGHITKIEPYGVPHSGVWRVYEDPQGNIWVVAQSGFFRVSATGLEPLFPGSDVTARFGYSDREGDLWVSDESEGLVRIKDRVVRMYTTSDGLPNNRVRTVLRNHDGTLWVGNNCGGVSRFDGKRFHNYNEKDGLSNSCVWAMAEDNEHNLWIGTWGGGLYRFRDGQFTQYSEQQGLPSSVVICIFAAPDGSLWIATSAGLSHMQNGHFRNYSVADGLSSDLITTVYQDRSGTVWIGTSVGVDRLAGERFVAVPRDTRSSDAPFHSLREDSSGDLYAFSQVNGISRLKDDQFFSVSEALAWSGMIETGRHDLWFTGRQGIFRVAAGGLRNAEQDGGSPLDYSSFGPEDGMNSKECDSWGQPNMAITSEDILWVATAKGLARLDGQRFHRTNSEPAIYMEEVDVGRTKASPGRELVLTPGTYHVEFHFTAVDLVSPEKIRLQYRLDGVDPLWLDADSTRTAIYNSIPVGAHSFHIRACNRDGVWDRGGVVYSVIQQPFLYETTWFRLSALAVIGLLVAGMHRWRVHQLQQQEKKFREAVETMPALAFVADPRGSRTFLNRGWLEYTGLSSEQASGSGWEAAIHPDDLKRVSERWRESRMSGEALDYEARLRRGSDGAYRWFQTRARPLRDNRGTIVKWCAVATDIEDRKRAEQLQADLTHASRVSTMGEMVASISHELAQPIQITTAHAKASLRWLQRDPPDMTEVRKGTEKIMEAGTLASEIIDRLRSLYKKAAPKRELVAINEVIVEMAGMMGGKSRENGVSICIDLKDDLPKTVADRVQLQQVLMNLMLNGIEAMKDTGGVLTVKSQLCEDGQIQISIHDAGPGLPVGTADQIFDAFFTTKTQGSGMGLAISKSIVESQNGRIWVNGDDGRGATFHFTLPAAPAETNCRGCSVVRH